MNDIAFQLSNGKIVNSFDVQITQNSLGVVEEAGLKELLQEASKYYDANNMQIAVKAHIHHFAIIYLFLLKILSSNLFHI